MKIEVNNIVKQYTRGGRHIDILKGVSLSVSSGEFISVTGRSGSGKSTLVNIIAGLTKPTSGNILWDGKDIFSFSDKEMSLYRNATIGCAPQEHSALSSLTVLENVRLPFHFSPHEGDSAEKASELLKQFHIEPLADSLPKSLSGGELKRMAIARAMINKPGFLLVDEPTGDLDTQTTHVIMKIFRKAADEGMAVLMITHDKDTVEYADKNFIMESGTLTQG
jgi:ABC-type lipoprotein export system ATPase subunit